MQTAKAGSRYTSTAGSFREDGLPWRLYQKAKRLFWDPADIDLEQDARDWAELEPMERRLVARLAAGFMAGEEAVTMDILPLLKAMADLGRTEDTMFLTTFAFVEAKHTEFFRRWFDAVGFDEPLHDLLTPSYARLFDEEQPRVMNRLMTDHSAEALLDAGLTYNQFVEGVLAITGYHAWYRIFTERGILPGLRQGLEGIQRDERRHIAYGTYICRRAVAEEPELWPFVERRMGELQALGMSLIDELGTSLLAELKELGGDGEATLLSGQSPEELLQEFATYALTQFSRRMQVVEVARRTSVEDVERGNVEEELEADLDRV